MGAVLIEQWVEVAAAILLLPPGLQAKGLDQNRRAGGAPQAARMSSFVHPAQHLYSRGDLAPAKRRS